jgi:hypothetical protein
MHLFNGVITIQNQRINYFLRFNYHNLDFININNNFIIIAELLENIELIGKSLHMNDFEFE